MEMAIIQDFARVGFIGLGAMGRPMVSHLANKLPADSQIWVYDVVEQIVDKICAEYPGRVLKATNPRNVAEQVVGHSPNGMVSMTDSEHRTRS